MIYTVTLNPAVDYVMHLPALVEAVSAYEEDVHE